MLSHPYLRRVRVASVSGIQPIIRQANTDRVKRLISCLLAFPPPLHPLQSSSCLRLPSQYYYLQHYSSKSSKVKVDNNFIYREESISISRAKLKNMITDLPPHVTLNDLVLTLLNSHKMKATVTNHLQDLRTRVMQQPPSPYDLKATIHRLAYIRQHISLNDFYFLLSTVTDCLKSLPDEVLSPVLITKALVSLNEFDADESIVHNFVQSLEPKMAHTGRHCSFSQVEDVALLLNELRRNNCQESWVVKPVVNLILSCLGATDSATSSRSRSHLSIKNGKQMSQLLFSLKGLSSPCPAHTLVLVDMIASWVRASEATMTPPQWSSALCGLSRMTSTCSEVTNLLFAIAEKMQCDPLSPVDATTTSLLPPIRSLDEDGYDVSDTAQSFQQQGKQGKKRGEESAIRFPPSALAHAMYGLRFMDSKHPAVALVVRNITATTQTHLEGLFEGRDVALTLYGMNHMSSQDESVRDLCGVLAEKMGRGNIRASSLQNIDVAMACRGLEGLSSDREQVRQLVRVLAEALQDRQASLLAGDLKATPFTGQMVSQAVFGLQLMDNRHLEVEMLVYELGRCIEQGRGSDSDFSSTAKRSVRCHSKQPATDSLNVKELCNALYGLRSMTSIAPSSESQNSSSCSTDVVEDILSSVESPDYYPAHTRNRKSSNAVENLLNCIFDRTGKILESLQLLDTESTSEVSTPSAAVREDARKWIEVEPMHFAHALYGIQGLGPDMLVSLQSSGVTQSSTRLPFRFERDYTSDVVGILVDVQKVLPLISAPVHKTSLDGDEKLDLFVSLSTDQLSLFKWTPYRLHDCLYGMLSLDFTTNNKSKQLLKYFFKIAKLMFKEEKQMKKKDFNYLSSDGITKLYHTLLFFQGKALLSPEEYNPAGNNLPRGLYNRLVEVISFASSTFSPSLPSVSNTSSLSKHIGLLEEILSSLNTPSEFNEKGYSYRLREYPGPRKIKAFYNTYLHGFHADIVLVGYFDEVGKEEVILRQGVEFEDEISYASSSSKSNKRNYYNVQSINNTIKDNLAGEMTAFESFVNNSYSSQDLVVVNVEVDGGYKIITGNYNRDIYRDNYLLKKYNILVKRINLSQRHKLSPISRFGEIVDFILDS